VNLIENAMKNLKSLRSVWLLSCFLVLSACYLHAQTTTFTYQGRVQDNGTNYTGTGQFKFALEVSTNTSSQPIALINYAGSLGNLNVESVTVNYGGSGYVTAPAVTFTGGDPNPTAYATISGGSITAITVTSAGDYPFTGGTGIIITIAPPPNNFTNLAVWSNDGTTGIGSIPTGSLTVGVTNGLFTVNLGDPTVAGMAALPASVFNQTSLQLLTWFNDGVNGFLPFPAQTLTPAPYATIATSANALNGSLALAQLPAGTVTNGSSGLNLTGNFYGNGAGLAGLNAANLTGTLPLGQLPASVVTNGASGVTLNGTFSGNGSGLTGLSIANGNGSISLAQLPAGAVTNTATGVTLNNFSVTGSLTLPNPAAIDSGGSPLLHDDTGSDFFAGKQAGIANTQGNFNTGLGDNALAANTTGLNNTASGYSALAANTTGSNNLAAGFNALPANTTGNYNTAYGGQSLYSNTAGNYNTALGFDAMKSNSVGNNIVAVGYQAMENGTNLNDSTAVGYQALKFSIIDGTGFGDENTAVGSQALEFTTSGEQNTAMGMQALLANTEGYQNTAIGVQALQANTTGGANTAIGMQALQSNTINGGNTAIGYGALQALSLGNNNIALGIQAGQNLPTGSYNIYIGNWGNYSEENGIIRIGTPGTQTATYLAGNVYASGNIYANGSVELTSDRNAKENFAPVDNQAVLARVAALPLTQWNYKTDPKNVRHLGPMAQDFQAAFGLDGADDKHISVVDEGGVALAAIQGLNQEVQAKAATIQAQGAEIQTLRQQNDALAAQLQQLTATVKALAEKR